MKPHYKLLFISLLLAGALPCLKAHPKTKPVVNKQATREGFLENKGQIIDQNNQPNPAVRYLFNQPGLNLQLRANGFSYDAYKVTGNRPNREMDLLRSNEHQMSDEGLSLQFHRIDIVFVGANPSPSLLAEDPGADYLNYYTTGTPEAGVLGVRHFGKVTYRNLYPGIDLEFLAKPGTQKPVEYNFIIHPGADPSLIQWKYLGSNSVDLAGGSLEIGTALGLLTEKIPLSYLKENGRTVSVRYRQLGEGVFGFEGASVSQSTLIIDPLPILNWATYYGGTVLDELSGVASDASGNVLVTGETTSTSTIATTGAYQTTYQSGTVQYGWGGDAFIAKMTSSGTRIWGTYFGGTGEDMGWSLEVNQSTGDMYVTGDTKSTSGIATTGAFQTTMAGSYHDPFLVKFSSSGARLWGTYFGGTGNDRATRNGIALDASGNVYFCGTNNTANDMWITTVGAYQRTNLSTSAYDEPFVAKFSPSGSIIWGTYYGGTLHDQCFAMALDKSNNVYLTGNVTSTSLVATTGAYQTTLAGGQDAFIAKLNSTGSALIWATYYGGTGTDIGNSIAVDANGDVYMSGYTTSTAGIASTGAHKTTYQGGSYDGFLVKFSSTGSRIWGTYTGGADYDLPRSMAIDASGDVLITGHTATTGLGTAGAYQTTYIGGTYDGYISKYSPAGALKLFTYFGGPLEDIPWNIEVDSKSNILIVGRTTSTSGLATSGVYQTTFGGGTYDGFIYKFQDLVADISMDSLALIPNPVCSNHDADVVVRLKNNGPIPAMQMMLALDMPGISRITRMLILNSLAVGKDTIIKIPALFRSNTSGLGLKLTALNMFGDLNPLNDTAKLKIDILPSPSGSSLIKGVPFTSPQFLTTGTTTNPDIVAEKDTLTYEITTPKGYNNKDYGSTWRIGAVSLRTGGGRFLSSTYYRILPASLVTNARVRFLPDMALTDTSISLSVVLQELGSRLCDSVLIRSIFVAPRPFPDFKFSTVCDGDNVVFTNTTKISSGNFTSKWDFGTGSAADTANTTDVIFRFPTHGQYQVKLITTSSPYGYVTSKTLTVVVNEIPKISFKVFNACFGDSVSFVNGTTISAGTIAYQWDFGNGKTSTKTSPKQKYLMAGSYKVTLSATSNGCSQTLSKNAWEFARPVAKFSVPAVLCDKTDIPLLNGSTISMGNMGYRWTFSDGGTSTATNPEHMFADAGSKTIKMKAISEFGCTDSVSKNIMLEEAPHADFSVGPVCNLSNTQFTFTGTRPGGGVVTVFMWDFGAEGSTTLENPSKLLKSVGKTQVSLTVTSNNGCSDKIIRDIDVRQQSKAAFEASDVCDGQEAVFINNSSVASGNLNYLWKFGDGITSVSQSPRHLYAGGISKTYNVTLVAIIPGGCSDSVTRALSVNTTPLSDFSYSTSGRLVNFKAAQAGNTTYHWDFGDGASSETMNSQYHYLHSFEYGRFKACLLVGNAAGCISQTCKEVVITGNVNALTKEEGIRIYPNPNTGKFKVQVENPASDLQIQLLDAQGRLVTSVKTDPMTHEYALDLDLASGVYVLKVLNAGSLTNHSLRIGSR